MQARSHARQSGVEFLLGFAHRELLVDLYGLGRRRHANYSVSVLVQGVADFQLTHDSDVRFVNFSGLLYGADRGFVGAGSVRETFDVSIALGRRLAELDLENPRAPRRSRRSPTHACTRLPSRSVPLSSCRTGA